VILNVVARRMHESGLAFIYDLNSSSDQNAVGAISRSVVQESGAKGRPRGTDI